MTGQPPARPRSDASQTSYLYMYSAYMYADAAFRRMIFSGAFPFSAEIRECVYIYDRPCGTARELDEVGCLAQHGRRETHFTQFHTGSLVSSVFVFGLLLFFSSSFFLLFFLLFVGLWGPCLVFA